MEHCTSTLTKTIIKIYNHCILFYYIEYNLENINHKTNVAYNYCLLVKIVFYYQE